MAQITPDEMKSRMSVVRRIDLASGDYVFILPPSAGDLLRLSTMEESDRVIYLLSRILCDEDGALFYPNGNGPEEVAGWPAETISEIANSDFLELNQAELKKN